jgi:hypothetical protein
MWEGHGPHYALAYERHTGKTGSPAVHQRVQEAFGILGAWPECSSQQVEGKDKTYDAAAETIPTGLPSRVLPSSHPEVSHGKPLSGVASTPDTHVIPPQGRDIAPFPLHTSFPNARTPSRPAACIRSMAKTRTHPSPYGNTAAGRTGLVAPHLEPSGCDRPRTRPGNPSPRPG